MATVTETFMRGARHHQAGRVAQAERAYRQVLRLDPKHLGGMRLLGSACQELGKNEDAIKYLGRAIAAETPSADLYAIRGAAYAETEDHEAAVDDFRRALKMAPDDPSVLSNLGNSLNELQEYEEAAGHLRQAVELAPKHVPAHVNLGRALSGLGQFVEATHCQAAALKVDPDCAIAYRNLANALCGLNQPKWAVDSYRRAIELDPGCAAAHMGFAALMYKLENYDEAIASYERAIDLDPGNLTILAQLASSLETANRLEESMEYVTRGLAIDPDDVPLATIAAKCHRRNGNVEKALSDLEAAVQKRGGIEECSIPNTLFELGQLHDRTADEDRAFACFARGNALQSKAESGPKADKNLALEEVDLWSEVFQEDWVNSWYPVAPGEEAETPVFMIGFPRSGTTLLQEILDSHTDIQALEERPTIIRVKRKMAEISDRPVLMMMNLTPTEVSQLREAYFEEVDRHLDREPGKILVDKMPVRSKDVAFIFRMFPKAKFVMSIRHPCDVCLSCFMQNFVANRAMANFHSLEDTVYYYVKIMELWQQYLRVLPLSHHVIRYEDLVDDFEGEVRRLLDFLELEWDDAVLKHHEHSQKKKKIRTASYHQVVEPIYRRSRYRWRRYAKYFEPFMDQLQPFIDYYGYGDQ